MSEGNSPQVPSSSQVPSSTLVPSSTTGTSVVPSSVAQPSGGPTLIQVSAEEISRQVAIAVAEALLKKRKVKLDVSKMAPSIRKFSGDFEEWLDWKERMKAFSQMAHVGDHLLSPTQQENLKSKMNTQEVEDFMYDDESMVGVLRLAISDRSLAHELKDFTNMADLWAFLVNRFESKTKNMIIMLEERINKFKIDESEKDVVHQLEKLRMWRVQLEKAGVMISEDIMARRILKALPSSWEIYSHTGESLLETAEMRGEKFGYPQ